MKIGDRVFVCGYIDEIRKDTIIIRNAGGYFGTIPSEVMGELPSAKPERMTNGQWMNFRRKQKMKIKSETKESVKIAVKSILIGATSTVASICATDATLKVVKRLPIQLPLAPMATVASVATMYGVSNVLIKTLFDEEEEESQTNAEKEISMLKEERERLNL